MVGNFDRFAKGATLSGFDQTMMAPIIMAFASDLLEIQFWCCPGLGHLDSFIKLHCGVFV